MGRFPPWADLPQELLIAIATFLTSNPIDILRFRTVCKSWLSTSHSPSLSNSSLSPPLPLTLPTPPHSFWISPVILSPTIIYALHPPSILQSTFPNSTWLLFVNQLSPGKVCIRNPNTGRPFSMPLDFPRKLNLPDFGASEIGRFYNLTPDGHKRFQPNGWSDEFLKVIFVSKSSIIVALFEGNLGLLRLGTIENKVKLKWEIILKDTHFDDIVEYDGRLLGINSVGGLYEMMGHDVSGMREIVPPITDMGGGGKRKRLVESSGGLYLVSVTSNVAHNIRVYGLNEETRRWIEVTSIGDQILFIGFNFSFSASAQEFQGFCGKNCIIFEQPSFEKSGYLLWCHDLAWSCLKVGACHLEDGVDVRAIESYPCYSDILWPPPTWIWMNTKSKLLGTLEAAIDRLLMGSQDENLKAKYKKLSSPVRLVVSGAGIGQQDMLSIMKEIDILKEFMNEIDLEIEKEMRSIRKQILVAAATRRTQRDSMQLSNQVGTSSSDQRTEIRYGCVGCFLKATQDSNMNSNEWLSREMRRRLGTHVELSAILRGAVQVLEKNLDLSKLLGTLEAAIDRLLKGSQDENLKAKYKELSSPVRLVVSGAGLGQQDVLNIMKEIDILKEFLNEIDLEVEKEMKSIRKHIAEDAARGWTQSGSMHLSDQVGTSSSNQRTEIRYGCVGCIWKATQESNINSGDWVSREMRCRLGIHVELSAILRGAIHVLGKNGVVRTS